MQDTVLLSGQKAHFRIGHNIQIGQREQRPSLNALDELIVAFRKRLPLSGVLGQKVIIGIAGGVGCGHAAHRGNDQRRSSEKRYCLPR